MTAVPENSTDASTGSGRKGWRKYLYPYSASAFRVVRVGKYLSIDRDAVWLRKSNKASR